MLLYYLNAIINNFSSHISKNKCNNMDGKLLFFRFEKTWHYFSHFWVISIALTRGDIFSQHWKFWERFVISAWPIHSSNTWHSSFFHPAMNIQRVLWIVTIHTSLTLSWLRNEHTLKENHSIAPSLILSWLRNEHTLQENHSVQCSLNIYEQK